MYLLNAFSLQTLDMSFSMKARVEVRKIGVEEAKRLLEGREFISAVGHESTAEVISKVLGMKIPVNRIRITLNEGDEAVVFQLHGRPPEGKILSAEEIEQVGFSFYHVKVTYFFD